MKKQETLLMFDLWRTLIYCDNIDQKIQNFIAIVLSSSDYNKEEVFKDWKNMWFKRDTDISEFISFLSKKYELSIDKQERIKRIIPYSMGEINLYPDTIPVLEFLRDKGIELILISDSGPDSKKYFVEQGLNKYFKHVFFSFEEGTTKNEQLFDIVISKLNLDLSSLIMIGNDYNRDYIIPKQKGIKAILIDRERRYAIKNSIQSLYEIIPVVLENGN